MSDEDKVAEDIWLGEPPEGLAQRQRAIKIISLCALGLSSLYVVLYVLLEAYPLASFSMLTGLLYGLIAAMNKPATMRVLGISLMVVGVCQLAGIAFLFLPPSAGSHFYLMVIPIFSLIVIDPRDRIWCILLTALVLLLIGWLEWRRDLWVPPYGAHLMNADLSIFRALAAFFTVALSFYVFRSFHRDLHVARKDLHRAYDRSEALLRNMLPISIARRLKKEQRTIADAFEDASVLFADLVGFTSLAASQPASDTVVMLNTLFSAFDEKVAARGLEKIKTIGDAYMVAGGLPNPQPNHATQLLGLAIDMLAVLRRHNEEHGHDLHLRIGLCTGPLVAGVIGSQKLSYDIWGDTVNVASRMESTGIPGRIQVTEGVVDATIDDYQFEERGMVKVKGRGEMRTFLVVHESSDSDDSVDSDEGSEES